MASGSLLKWLINVNPVNYLTMSHRRNVLNISLLRPLATGTSMFFIMTSIKAQFLINVSEIGKDFLQQKAR